MKRETRVQCNALHDCMFSSVYRAVFQCCSCICSGTTETSSNKNETPFWSYSAVFATQAPTSNIWSPILCLVHSPETHYSERYVMKYYSALQKQYCTASHDAFSLFLQCSLHNIFNLTGVALHLWLTTDGPTDWPTNRAISGGAAWHLWLTTDGLTDRLTDRQIEQSAGALRDICDWQVISIHPWRLHKDIDSTVRSHPQGLSI